MKKKYVKPDLERLIFNTVETLTTDENDGGGLDNEFGSTDLPGGW